MASRANHRVLLGCALVCAAALLCLASGRCRRRRGGIRRARSRLPSFPIASDVRLAGDAKQTRFVLDLDKTVPFRAFRAGRSLSGGRRYPAGQLSASRRRRHRGRGLIKAFRYGLVMPGGSRIVFDLTGPARIANAYVLDAANGQPPRLVLELEEVDRTTFVQSLAAESRPELRPAIEAGRRRSPTKRPLRRNPRRRRICGPLVVIDPGHGGIDNGTQSGSESEKNLVLGFWAGVARSHRKKRQIPRRHDPHRRYLHSARPTA